MWLEISNINLVRKKVQISQSCLSLWGLVKHFHFFFLGLFAEVFKIQMNLKTPNQTYPHVETSVSILKVKIFIFHFL